MIAHSNIYGTLLLYFTVVKYNNGRAMFRIPTSEAMSATAVIVCLVEELSRPSAGIAEGAG